MEAPINTTTDRFTNLPELVINRIVAHLGPNDILRVTCLSRKFRNICLTNPVLDFKAACPGDGRCFCSEFFYSINTILVRRNGQPIQRLRLHWYINSLHWYSDNICSNYCIGVGSLLHLWIRYAADCKVQELDICYSPGRDLAFPSVDYLKELKLDLSGKSFSPPPKAFPCLVFLSLRNIVIKLAYDGRIFGEWLSDTCVNLRILCLQNVDIREIPQISMSSSSLEQLTVSGCSWIDVNICCSSLKTLTVSECKLLRLVVSAERLQVFRLDLTYHLDEDYRMPRFSFTEELFFLKDAFVRLQALHRWDCLIRNRDFTLEFGIPHGRHWSCYRSPSGQLDCLSHIITLEIYLLPLLFGLGLKLATFCNLQHLVLLVGRFEGDEDATIMPSLRELVNLRTLTLKLDDYPIAVVDNNVMYIMCLRATNYMANDRTAKKVVFSLEDSDLEIDPDEDNSGLLEEILNYESALQRVKFIFAE